MTPWSVSPSAGWSNSAARAARPSILQAPSSSEYSEWTWRCTAAAMATPSMRSRSDGAGNDPALWGFLDYGRGMGLILALAVAVAGGNLVVTTAPEKVHSGHTVQVRATGQVGDSGGHLWIFHDRKGCAVSARGERRRGTLIVSRPITGSFDFESAIRPRRVGRLWVCGYLYAITCDAAGANCAPATGLPPDAGFSRALVGARSWAVPGRGAAPPAPSPAATTPAAPSFIRFC